MLPDFTPKDVGHCVNLNDLTSNHYMSKGERVNSADSTVVIMGHIEISFMQMDTARLAISDLSEGVADEGMQSDCEVV